jgi:hypothetical protein
MTSSRHRMGRLPVEGGVADVGLEVGLGSAVTTLEVGAEDDVTIDRNWSSGKSIQLSGAVMIVAAATARAGIVVAGVACRTCGCRPLDDGAPAACSAVTSHPIHTDCNVVRLRIRGTPQPLSHVSFNMVQPASSFSPRRLLTMASKASFALACSWVMPRTGASGSK